MSGIRMQITGLDKLQKIANNLGRVQGNKVIDKAIQTAAFIVEGESKKVTPVDTGFLRSSITTAYGHQKATISPRAAYGLFVHEGTKFFKGRPFFEIGAQNAKPEVEEAIKLMLDDIAQQMVK